MSDDVAAARCPDCRKVGMVAGAAAGWWFYCPTCRRRWGHPQMWTLDTAQEAVAAARAEG